MMSKQKDTQITFKSNALCLQTPNCKAPKGTTMEFRLSLIERIDFSQRSERTISVRNSSTGLVDLLLLFPVEQVQTKGFR